jgi:hypothetical protein
VSTIIKDASSSIQLVTTVGTIVALGRLFCHAARDFSITNGSSVAMDIFLSGFVDGVLGVGSNPIL